MSTPDDAKASLLQRMRSKRDALSAYISFIEPQGRLMSDLATVGSALATALTAGPALFGRTATQVTDKALGIASTAPFPSWRLLCIAACLTSLVAAIAGQLYKSREIASRLGKAQACNTKVAGLEMLLELGHIKIEKAAELFVQYCEEVSFVPDLHPRNGKAAGNTPE
jgi:hypothetical protein